MEEPDEGMNPRKRSARLADVMNGTLTEQQVLELAKEEFGWVFDDTKRLLETAAGAMVPSSGSQMVNTDRSGSQNSPVGS